MPFPSCVALLDNIREVRLCWQVPTPKDFAVTARVGGDLCHRLRRIRDFRASTRGCSRYDWGGGIYTAGERGGNFGALSTSDHWITCPCLGSDELRLSGGDVFWTVDGDQDSDSRQKHLSDERVVHSSYLLVVFCLDSLRGCGNARHLLMGPERGRIGELCAPFGQPTLLIPHPQTL